MTGGGLILDVGCGGGEVRDLVRARFPDSTYIGLEPDPEWIPEPVEGAPSLSGSVYNLPFADGSVDTVLFLQLFEHLDRPVDAVRELNRVLKPGGEIILSTVSAAYAMNYVSELKVRIKKALRKPQPRIPLIFDPGQDYQRHIFEISPACVHTLLHINGFEFSDDAFCHGFHPAIDWLVRLAAPFAMQIYVIRAKKVSAPPRVIV